MLEVVGVVDVLASPGRGDEVIAALETCLTQSHQEEGCLTYALHRDNDNPDHIVLVERWRSQPDLDEHMQKPYVADLFTAAGTPGLLAEAPRLTYATSLPLGDPAKGSL